MRPKTTAAAATILCLACFATGCASAPPAAAGRKLGGPLRNVSGMALVLRVPEKVGPDSLVFLVAHDNKNPGEPRLGTVRVHSGSPPLSYEPLSWPAGAEPPVDLEAICPVPTTRGSYLAMTSAGRLLHLRVAGRDVPACSTSRSCRDSESLPNLEGFALRILDGITVAAWAERGNGDEPAVLYWGTYDPVADVVTLVDKVDVKVPFPATATTRHISDLRVDAGGVVWGTAASDPGDAGPYQSAFYELGMMRVDGGKVTFSPSPELTPRWKTNRKVEALELLPGDEGLVYFGADDENAGGWLYTGRRRP